MTYDRRSNGRADSSRATPLAGATGDNTSMDAAVERCGSSCDGSGAASSRRAGSQLPRLTLLRRRRFAVRAYVAGDHVERGRYFTRAAATRTMRRMNGWPTFGSRWQVVEL